MFFVYPFPDFNIFDDHLGILGQPWSSISLHLTPLPNFAAPKAFCVDREFSTDLKTGPDERERIYKLCSNSIGFNDALSPLDLCSVSEVI